MIAALACCRRCSPPAVGQYDVSLYHIQGDSVVCYRLVAGMFELNNLALAVPSPVEDYFLLVDGLPETERGRVQAVTGRWLDALDKWYDTCCEVRRERKAGCSALRIAKP